MLFRSLLNAIALPELIAGSLAEYEACALSLAQEPGGLAAIRAKLARNRETCPLFDTPLYVRHLDEAFLRMHERAMRGLGPVPFGVEASA